MFNAESVTQLYVSCKAVQILESHLLLLLLSTSEGFLLFIVAKQAEPQCQTKGFIKLTAKQGVSVNDNQ